MEFTVKKYYHNRNNTFINFLCGSQPMIRGNIRGTVIFRNLLLWSNTNDEKAKTSYLLNVHSATPSVVTFENLLKFDKGKDIPTNYWMVLFRVAILRQK